jgi:hypothetical protein
LRPFQKVQIHPHTPSGSGVMVIASWGGVSGRDRLSCLDELEP